jgi:hypothetical protein
MAAAPGFGGFDRGRENGFRLENLLRDKERARALFRILEQTHIQRAPE